MATLEDDKIINALKQTLQHISIQQKKFTDIDVELQKTKQELQKEKEHYSEQCSQLKTQIDDMYQEIKTLKNQNEEKDLIISEMKVESAYEQQQNVQLKQELHAQKIAMQEMEIEKEKHDHTLVEKLENDNAILQQRISTLQSKIEKEEHTNTMVEKLENENAALQEQIGTLQNRIETEKPDHAMIEKLEQENNVLQQKIDTLQRQTEEEKHQHVVVQKLEHENTSLQQKIATLQNQIDGEQEIHTKYNDCCARMNQMNKCSFSMLESCRTLRRSINDTTTQINDKRNESTKEFAKINKFYQTQIDKMSLQNSVIQQSKITLKNMKKDIFNELSNFNAEIKSIQRAVFKQKTIILKDEKNKELNMEQELEKYLKQKALLEQKINSLEGCLKEKNDKDLITEMKRFRTAAVVTSVTSLSENGAHQISYHKLSEHEKKAISLKSKFQKKIESAPVDINEKIDDFIRSGGLKRYPILEQEFVYKPTDDDPNQFQFGTRYISIFYNHKQNNLFVKNNENDVTKLDDWILKNSSIEMRKLLSKVSQKKKINKQSSNQ